VFDYELEKGTKESALQNPNSIIISKELAKNILVMMSHLVNL
jgi:hypothetical protein